MEFLFVGNNLALDLVNTEMMQAGRRVDLLDSPEALALWLKEALKPEGKAPARHAAAGTELQDRARALRAALREIAEALATGKEAPVTALEEVNALLQRRVGYAQVAPDGAGGYARRLVGEQADEALDLLVPVAEAAAALLCDTDPARVRRCGNPECILYFLDTSKNGARRWCSMSGCGNRAKAAAHYARYNRRGAGAAGASG